MAPLNYRSAEDCMFFTGRKGFLQTEISVYCHPALDWHPKSLCIASDKTTRNCNYLHWSEIWPSCPLQFGGKSLISFMGRENARARQGYWPRPAREELTAAKKNISNVSAHESSRSCAVRAYPSQENIISFSSRRRRRSCETGRDEEQEAVLYAPPTFTWGEERRGDGSIVQPASRWKAPKVNIRLGTMEKTKSGLLRVEQARTSEQSVKTRHRLVWRTLISQSHQVITPGDFPAWQKEGLISRAWKVLMKWSEGKARASEGA